MRFSFLSMPLLCLVMTLAWLQPLQAASQPNIVFILADDLGYADLGFQGSHDISTPQLDRLAESGIRFTSGYSSHPFCSPMRAGLMSGRYQHRFGYERNIAYDPHNNFMGLPAREKTVATRLKDAGYVTGMVGKWHLGAAAPFLPNRRGFDFFYGFAGGGHDYFDVDLTRPMSEAYRQPLHRNGQPESLTNYLTDALTHEAVNFVKRESANPFFLYLAYNAPHTPLQAPKSALDKVLIADKKRRTYAAMVQTMDEGIGRLIKTLDDLNLRTNTLVFFLSDNGGPEQSNASDNGPLKGSKGDVTEGGIRVPFLVSWPGTLPDHQTSEIPVISLDLVSTALKVAGVRLLPRLEGIDLMSVLTDANASIPERSLFWRKENGAAWAVRSGHLKLLQAYDNAPLELYDLDSDLGETRNLAAIRPAEVARLQKLYQQWNQANQPPFFPSFRDYHKRMREVHREFTTPDQP